MKSNVIFLLLLPAVMASARLNVHINSLVPTGGEWIAITNKGLVVLKEIPHNATLSSVVKEICKTPYLNVYVAVNAPWACTVEALSLLKKPEPIILWNSTPSNNITCDQRYLFSQLLSSIVKGKGATLIYPLDNTICKRVYVDASITNNTLVVRITVKKIKPWLDICPPSKVYDVVIAWGKADRVVVFINDKIVLEERSP